MKKKNIIITAAVMAVVLAGAYTALHIVTCPTWQAAKLTVKQGESLPDAVNISPEGDDLESRISPPEGYTRVSAEEGSFAEYLRSYPLLPHGSELPVYDGTSISSGHTAAVFDISLGDEGYQQCADSIIRLYSDYYYTNGQYDKISFHFTSGLLCDYQRWRKGRRILAFGDFSYELPVPIALYDDSEQQYRNYLKEVMRYAGTLSLLKESRRISVDELRTGDIIINDTHVVMIADEAVNADGEKCFLIGQSFIPAVCFHIVNGGGEGKSPWFTAEQLSQENFTVSGFSFMNKDLRRLDFAAG